MKISSKLQDQIYFLCSKIPNLEWSGVLFYTTEGNFGEDGFKVTCEEVYPLDIGSSGYTEYDTDDPDFIKYMMANPHILDMRKGHCHSHNTMDTFFSGTDTDELKENCPNHNFYVSLIVNNANDNCAKIAFLVTEITETPATEIPETIITTEARFKNQDGNEVIKKMQKKIEVQKIEATKKESKSVFVYDCEIEYPGTVGGTLTARFQQLSENIRKREEERVKQLQKARKNFEKDSPYHGYQGNSDLFGRKPAWNQPELFDSRSGSNRGNSQKEKGEKGKTGREINIPPNVSGKNLLKMIENGDRNYGTYKKNNSAVYSQLPKSTKTDIYSMLGKLLTLDPMNEDHLPAIISRISSEFYPTGMRSIELKSVANKFYDAITERATSFYSIVFSDDKRRVRYEDTMEAAIQILNTFDTHFPEFIDQTVEAIKETFNKSSKESRLFS